MKTILLLDDESVVMDLLRQVLQKYALIEATTAEQALRLFNKNGRQLDLLLADVILPESSGIHLALLLRLEIPDLPVILTSGYPIYCWNERDCADLERLGSNRVTTLQKPFYPQDVWNAVWELIGKPPTEMVRTA
jgi:CheY-like chemotaxis protein